MKRLKFLFLSLFFALCALHFTFIAPGALAQAISSTELINNAKALDGQTVVYKGEVIGDVMRRGDFAWINVNDGQNAIGIWISTALTKQITFAGSYKSKGDIVEVTGIFHRACPEHGGDLDIHAQQMRLIEVGSPRPERASRIKRNVAIALLAALGLIWILKLLKRK